MKNFLRFTKSAHFAIAATVLAMSLQLPVANAAMVGTDAVINTASAQQDRDRIQETLNREEVKAKLLALGVDPIQVQDRVNALTVSEVQTLAKNIDQMPAGAGIIDILIVILLLILIL